MKHSGSVVGHKCTSFVTEGLEGREEGSKNSVSNLFKQFWQQWPLLS